MFDDMTDLEKVERIRAVLLTLKADATNEYNYAWEDRDKVSADLWAEYENAMLIGVSLIDQAFPQFRDAEIAAGDR